MCAQRACVARTHSPPLRSAAPPKTPSRSSDRRLTMATGRRRRRRRRRSLTGRVRAATLRACAWTT
jgi:hypothetical protein